MATPPIHIAIVNDHELFGLGLKGLIADFLPEDSISVMRSGQNFIDFLESGKSVDLLLLDLDMPNIDGKRVIKYLKEKCFPIKSIIISMHNEPAIMEECEALGADGFIKKDSSLSILKEGICTVMNGMQFFPVLNGKAKQLYAELSKTYGLTKREVEIIRMIKNNQSSHQIADILCISYQTVKTHRKNINSKLEITNVVALIEFAHRNNL